VARVKNLLEGDIAPHLRRLSFPMIAGLLAVSGSEVVITLYIARLGVTPLAAFGFTMPIVTFFMGVIFGLSVGTTSSVSRAFGTGDMEKVRRLVVDSLTLTFLIVSLAALIGHFLAPHIFRLMGADGEILDLASRYMTIWYYGMIFLALMMVGNAGMRATGDTVLPSSIMMLTALSNILIAPLFIFGLGPIPGLGLPGAAISVIAAYSLSSIVCLLLMVFRKKILSAHLFHPETRQSWARTLHVGIPSMASNLISPISAAAITWIVADLGSQGVAALGVATRIEALSLIVFYGLGAGLSIFTGQNFGAGNFGRIVEASGLTARWALIWGALVTGLLWIFGTNLAALFSSDGAVEAYVVQYLHIVPISYGAMGVLIASNAALNAMGRPLPATVFIFMRAFVLYVPLALVLKEHAGFAGIIAALVVTNVTIGILSYLWNKKVAQ